MSKYDSLRDATNGPCEQKLAVLLAEMTRCVYTISGYAVLIKQKANPQVIDALPEDFADWVDKIIAATDDLKELQDILT